MVKAETVFTGFRKEARARLRLKPGTGRVFVNGILADHIPNILAREKILAPLRLDEKFAKKHDFLIKVEGGGVMGQAEAASMAISRAMAAASAALKEKILSLDRRLIVGDPRRTEPKKPNRRSARRFKQKSYR
ncbi:MAG: 30S ribosomal protein S9 [Nitrososphaerota archaeon]|nr:30S ribosomal protein S9 [Candidatus Calditenuaceae archaeon]MDW8072627.1 30S ribosomal protein S9 [Nitrososphaerota archaeon]